jgi:hypothetical protein
MPSRKCSPQSGAACGSFNVNLNVSPSRITLLEAVLQKPTAQARRLEVLGFGLGWNRNETSVDGIKRLVVGEWKSSNILNPFTRQRKCDLLPSR